MLWGRNRAHLVKPRTFRKKLPERVTFGLSCDESGGEAEAGVGSGERRAFQAQGDGMHKSLEV